MMDGSAANHALRELDAVREAIDTGRYAEAALRIELLEQDIAGRDAAVVDVWQRLLNAERARVQQGQGVSRPA
ncbi:MAG TPA: hypothetical protein PLZ93_06990 [Nocardioides sp.]|uniref:hypothetical protein n=1 Tax=uncultured Nocardioides sp. TaxID=198441 RepID=UPI00260A4771|nr:hypothetical protein [uncultured Nocardioides sp.]HRD62155.1 hypothetical protein [Nocardioides sp.]HRI95340.1 hypothetical protein [Nocardioides sp.]HRK45599.1 hypothetical protein [Nocardioides sp.]